MLPTPSSARKSIAALPANQPILVRQHRYDARGQGTPTGQCYVITAGAFGDSRAPIYDQASGVVPEPDRRPDIMGCALWGGSVFEEILVWLQPVDA